jgi:hypothetical protein
VPESTDATNRSGVAARAARSALVALMATACGPNAVERAKDLAARDLRDPGSAQFRDVRTGDAGSICGEINAKNALGAYVGFQRFLVTGTDSVIIESEDTTIPRARWRLICEASSISSVRERDSLQREVVLVDSLNAALDSMVNTVLKPGSQP